MLAFGGERRNYRGVRMGDSEGLGEAYFHHAHRIAPNPSKTAVPD
jgi:hypothetical protein